MVALAGVVEPLTVQLDLVGPYDPHALHRILKSVPGVRSRLVKFMRAGHFGLRWRLRHECAFIKTLGPFPGIRCLSHPA